MQWPGRPMASVSPRGAMTTPHRYGTLPRAGVFSPTKAILILCLQWPGRPMAIVSLRRALTAPCRYGTHHNHSLLLSQNWVVENSVETHFRRGMARRSDGRSNSRSICVRGVSRIRRYCSSRSEGDACLGGGSSIVPTSVPVGTDVGTIDVTWIDEDDPYVNPIGSKGIGEIGIVGTAAAIANAVFHATGIRIRDLPITLDKLLPLTTTGRRPGPPCLMAHRPSFPPATHHA